MEQDWYMLTVAADLLAFLYAAMFYQVDTARPMLIWMMPCWSPQQYYRI